MSRDESTKSCIESFIEDEQLRFKFIKNDPLKVGSAESRVLLTPQIVHLSNAREGKFRDFLQCYMTRELI